MKSNSNRFMVWPCLVMFTLSLVTAVNADEATVNSAPQVTTTWGRVKAMYHGSEVLPSASLKNRPAPMWQTAADASWWRSLSQDQRNAVILQQAVNDYTTLQAQQGTSTPYCGLQCKPWVQQEVFRATRGIVWLPSTWSTGCSWYSSPYVFPVGYGPAGAPIEQARPGHIVQMVWNGGPHTALIHHVDAYGMWWLDSNFHIPFDDRLRIHYITYSDFHAKASCYLVYQVIGG